MHFVGVESRPDAEVRAAPSGSPDLFIATGQPDPIIQMRRSDCQALSEEGHIVAPIVLDLN